ncbi:MAG: FG-GAP-like repeat-containing protein, partial [Maioricimonas sp. JB049]
MRASRFLVVLAVGPAVMTAALLLYYSFLNSSANRIARAGEAIGRGDYSRALELTSHLLDEQDPAVEALLVGIAAARLGGRPERMLDLCRRIPPSASGPEVVQTLKTCGQTALRTGQAADAEAFYQRAVELAPGDLLVHRRLSALYLAQARRWESHPHLLALIKGKAFTLDNIGFLGNMEELYDAEQLIAHFERTDPDNLVPLMGRARLLLFKASPVKAEALLRRIVERHPDLIEAQAQLGVVFVSTHREADFYEWHGQLPEGADGHPEIWWVRATQARREGNRRAAIRCAWEALRLDPNHLGATYQLAQLLATEGHEQKAQVFAERAGRLEELASAIHHILLREATAEHMLQCAALCEQIGRVWEAWGWHVALETYHPDRVAEGERERLAALLTPSTPQTLPGHQLALHFDLSSYPLPDWKASSGKSAPKAGDAEFRARFADATDAVGLDFRYRNGVVEGKRGLMIHESIGGGVSVIDFDCDGSPDLFFPQARPGSPLEQTEEDASDQLFRNVGGKAVNVSSAALPADTGYGFGANVGDFNSDGFPDLYVGNAGRNILLLNNGDGTFSDVTDEAGIVDEQWTSSTLIADLNGDGLPDLYDVNYCGGDDPFEKVCLRQNGGARTCIPTEFAAADDRLLLNLGDGRFEDVSETAGILEPEGRGLGIVAANLDDHPGIDLYVANDMTANFFFSNRTEAAGDVPVFREQGVTSGLAY